MSGPKGVPAASAFRCTRSRSASTSPADIARPHPPYQSRKTRRSANSTPVPRPKRTRWRLLEDNPIVLGFVEEPLTIMGGCWKFQGIFHRTLGNVGGLPGNLTDDRYPLEPPPGHFLETSRSLTLEAGFRHEDSRTRANNMAFMRRSGSERALEGSGETKRMAHGESGDRPIFTDRPARVRVCGRYGVETLVPDLCPGVPAIPG